MSLRFQTKSDTLHRHERVNLKAYGMKVTYLDLRRSHGRVRVKEVSPVETTCREKKADAIVLVVF